jgi:hypothetical protein
MSFTVPAMDGGPKVAVSAWTIGEAAEILALAVELIDTAPGGAVRAQIEALMDRKGADPVRAADWMITSVRTLAKEMDGVLAAEGIGYDQALARYSRHPAAGALGTPGREGVPGLGRQG